MIDDRHEYDPQTATYAATLITTHGLDDIKDEDGWETLELMVRSRWPEEVADCILWLLEYHEGDEDIM